MAIDLVMVGQILTVVLGAAAGYAGKYLLDVKALLRELGESFTVTAKAIEDNTVTPEEMKAIIKEWGDVIRIFGRKTKKV